MNKKIKEKIYSISAIVIILDQLVKLIISRNISINKEIEVIPNFFSLFYVENKGAAFSILNNQVFLLVIISLVFLIIINKYIDSETKFNKYSIISLGIIIGGIIGNLIDRLIHNAVIDYLSFQFGSYFFPVFNIADICITVGIGLLLLSIVIEEINNKKKEIPIKEKLSKQVEIIKVEETKLNKKPNKNKKSKRKK